MKMLEINEQVYQYILDMNPIESPVLSALRDETDSLKYARLRTPTEQVHFMSFLVRWTRAQSILEIGTFTGYTTLAMAMASVPSAKITTCDINKVFPSIGLPYWKRSGFDKKITLVLGAAMASLQACVAQKNRFDFIYIDADKERNWQYLDLSLKCLAPRGIIVIDNVLWRGDVSSEGTRCARTRSIQAFNQKVKMMPNVHHCLLPVGDGLTMVSFHD